MKIVLKYKNKKITIDDVKECNLFQRFIGLMFSRRKKAQALLFNFKKPIQIPIHSWFVFFQFVAIWIDENGKVVQMEKIPSWKVNITPKKKFIQLVEIPLNDKYSEIMDFIVDIERFK